MPLVLAGEGEPFPGCVDYKKRDKVKEWLA
jgi:hypothetical protein